MRLTLQFLVLSLLVAFTGCKDDKINTYEVSKETPKDWPTANQSRQTRESEQGVPMSNPAAGTATSNAPQAAPSSGMQALPGMAQQSAGFQTPAWQVPENWKPQPLGSMRKGSWLIEENGKSAEVSVLAFPGSVGGLLANINRWAGQIGAASLNNQELETLKKDNALNVDGSNGIFVELNGPNGKSIGGVIVTRPEGTWFFKMQGDTEVVKSQAGSLGRFIASVKFK